MALEAILHFAQQHPPMPAPLLEREVTLRRGPRFFDDAQCRTLEALCHRVLPQATPRVAVPLAALLDARCYANLDDDTGLGPLGLRDAWQVALRAIDAEALQRHGKPFADLRGGEQDALIQLMRNGRLCDPAWGELAAHTFYHRRLLRDVSTAYYSHPAAWPSASIAGSFAFATLTSQE